MDSDYVLNLIIKLKNDGIDDLTIKMVEDAFKLADIHKYKNGYSKVNHSLTKVKFYLPESNTYHDLPINPTSIDMFKNFEPRKYMELVDQTMPQKVAIKIMNFEDKALLIKNSLQEYLLSMNYNNKISFTKVDDGYELIVQDLYVKNSKERVDFINKFKKTISNQLGEYISIYNTFNETEQHYWTSVNELTKEDCYEFTDNQLVSKTSKNVIYYISGNNNIVNVDCTNPTINTNSLPQSNPKDEFIIHIIENQPEWYIPNQYISIDVLYDKYISFDNSAKKRSFAKQFENILWDDKKQINRKMGYRLINLWTDV